MRGVAGVSDRGGLSAHVLPFFGRGEDRDRLERAVAEGTRLLTLVGPSGIGKSRLARAVSEGFREGRVSFCDLAVAKTAVDLRAAIAKAAGLRVGEGSGALSRGLQRQGRILLVLDNAEYVVREASDVIDAWLAECPKLQILATSLEPLGLPGETRVTLGPLAPDDAVALYLDRAIRAGGRHAMDRIAVEALVEKLDRIPLAIELAAARAHVLPPIEFLSRIGQRFEILQGGHPGRHGSLEKAISCSWELLGDHERMAIAQVAVFVGGFTLEAAEAVLDCGPGAPPVLELLASLVSKGLLAHDGGAPPRFAPYESLREYAMERLAEMEEVEATARRHQAYFLELGERLARSYEGPIEAQYGLDRERGNLLAAHRRALEEEPAVAARIGLALVKSYNRQGTVEAELALLGETIVAARQAESPRVLVRALVARVAAMVRLGRYEECRAEVEEALVLAREQEDREGELLALVEYGASACFSGSPDEGERLFLSALAKAREMEDVGLQAAASNGLAVVEFLRGSTEGAVPHFEEAVRLARQARNEVREASYASNLGHAYVALGDCERARSQLEAVIELASRRNDESLQGIAWVNLANVAATEGSLEEARACIQEGLPRVQRSGATRLEAAALGTLGQIAMERGELGTAKAKLREAAHLLEACGDTQLHCQVRTLLALAHALGGSLELAQESLEASEAMPEAREPALRAVHEMIGAIIRVSDERLFGEERGRAAEQSALALVEEIGTRGLRRTDLLVQSKRIARRFFAEGGEGFALGAGAIAVAGDGAYFELQRGRPISLRTRRPLRRILAVLTERRISKPGDGLPVEELARIAWPGETILPRAAANRVYNAVRTLRKMGLGDALLRQEDGYLLSPAYDVVWADER